MVAIIQKVLEERVIKIRNRDHNFETLLLPLESRANPSSPSSPFLQSERAKQMNPIIIGESSLTMVGNVVFLFYIEKTNK